MKTAVLTIVVTCLSLSVAACLIYLFVTAHVPSEASSATVWGTPAVPFVEVIGTRVNITKNELTIFMRVSVGSGGMYLTSISLPISGTVRKGDLSDQTEKSTDRPIRRINN